MSTPHKHNNNNIGETIAQYYSTTQKLKELNEKQQKYVNPIKSKKELMKEDLLNNMHKHQINCIPLTSTSNNKQTQQKYLVQKSFITYKPITEEALYHALNQIDPKYKISFSNNSGRNKNPLNPLTKTIYEDVRKTCSSAKPRLAIVNKMPKNSQVPKGDFLREHARSYITFDDQIKQIRQEFKKEMDSHQRQKAATQVQVLEFVKTQDGQKRKVRFSNDDTISLQRRLVTRDKKPKQMGMRDFKSALESALKYESTKALQHSSVVQWEVIKPKVLKRLRYALEQYAKEHQAPSVTTESLYMHTLKSRNKNQ